MRVLPQLKPASSHHQTRHAARHHRRENSSRAEDRRPFPDNLRIGVRALHAIVRPFVREEFASLRRSKASGRPKAWGNGCRPRHSKGRRRGNVSRSQRARRNRSELPLRRGDTHGVGWRESLKKCYSLIRGYPKQLHDCISIRKQIVATKDGD